MTERHLDAIVRGSLPPVAVSSARERRVIAATLLRLTPNGISAGSDETAIPLPPALGWGGFFQHLAVPLTAFAALGVIVGGTLDFGEPTRGLSHLIVSFATTLPGF